MKLERFEIPQRLTLVTEQWTPETELVTASLKLKRTNISTQYRQELDAMYNKWSSNCLENLQILAIKLIYITSLLDIQKTLADNNTFITLFLSRDYTSADNLKDDDVFQQNAKLLSESV